MKNFSQKMAETALLLSSFPNVIPIFIKGKFKMVSALLSRRIYQETIKGENPGANVSSLIYDIRNNIKDKVVTSETFDNLFLRYPTVRMVALLSQHRTF